MLLVAAAIRLRTQGVDGGTLAPVEHPILDAAGVGGARHLPSQGVQLTDKMPLTRAADGRVTGHIAHRIQIDGKIDRFQPEAGGGKSRLNARVPRADHGNIISSCGISHHVHFLFICVNRFILYGKQ